MDFESLIKNPPKKRVKSSTAAVPEIVPNNEGYDRNRQIALHHANLLQERKIVEAQILQSLEELIDFPISKSSPALSPSAEDLARFRQLIPPFSVSDYDALIEERTAARTCGYVFCANRLKKEALDGNYMRLVWGGRKGNDLKVVPNQKLEIWCSKACARRAMFVKVQLSETPAWERAGSSLKNQIQLLKETELEGVGSLHAQMARLALEEGDEGKLREAMEQLALERGESTTNSARLVAVMSAQLKENLHVGAPRAPTHSRGSTAGAIEGYTPRADLRNQVGSAPLDDEEEDDDWKVT